MIRPVLRRKSHQRPVSPEEWKTLIKTAIDHSRMAEHYLRRGDFHQATLSWIQAGYLLGEAVLAHVSGIRTASERHGELCYLLLRLYSLSEDGQAIRWLAELFDLKILAGWEGRKLAENEAMLSSKKFHSFYQWARTKLPMH
ncbi:MAG: hypothetical protein HYT76_01375 [Deltaproteobacteria bacterium]|nr:hypothetical protein [Deltaproteobacteria bacterium]